MKQVAQNYKSGELTVLDVPLPACKPGGVLVRSRYSLISTGTELMKVTEAQLSLLGKARARPDQMRKALETVNQLGPVAAYQKVVGRLDSYTPLGYSLCGVVTEVGRGAQEFSVGQLVACAGNEHAVHAEMNWVPVNLCVPVPDGVDARAAAFTTVGAIALHGVRRAEVQLGEAACVVGLGLVGQLVVRLLVAAGAKVVGLDPDEDRCRLGQAAGALLCEPPSGEGTDRIERALLAATGGLGADHVFIAAGGSSNEPIVAAARLARDRARIVDIGKCSVDLPWNDYYEKELDFRFSRSYGPGRYDPRYELEGIDYPAGYVRWTERRNLACFLDLLRGNQLSVDPLVSGVYPLTDAVDVYRQLSSGELRGVGFLFEYPDEVTAGNGAPARRPAVHLPSTPHRPVPGRVVRVGFLGAGNYASSMLLPHLARREDVQLGTVVTTTSLSATNAQRRFGFEQASTNASAILDDESIDAVFVVTRHHSHAELASRALEEGKAVFVEKPLALSLEELDRVLAAVGSSGNDRLMVGFNRRFAPLLVAMRSRFGTPHGPALVRYLVNAGRLEAGSWYSRSELEGSRFEGEGGHFVDTVSWWLDASPVGVHAVSTRDPDDLLATFQFDDGSIASLGYATGGSRRYPKETMEVSAQGRTARLDNFRKATVWSGRRVHAQRAVIGADKGQRQQLEGFLDAVRSGGPMPISVGSLTATTRATLAVTRSLASGRPELV